MIVHVQTSLNTIFGLSDDEGNVVEQFPVQLAINSLKPELFAEACKRLLANRDELIKKTTQSP